MSKLNWVVTISGNPGTRIVDGRFETKELAEQHAKLFFGPTDDAQIDFDPNRQITSALQDKF